MPTSGTISKTELRGELDQTPGEALGAVEGSLEEGGAR